MTETSMRSYGPKVSVLTAPNPSIKTLEGTNSYIVGDNVLAIIDPGPSISAHLDGIVSQVDHRNVLGIFLTHSHPDHAPAAEPLARILKVPIFAAPDVFPEFGPDLVVTPLKDGGRFDLDGMSLQAVAAPGHSADHFCFLLEPNRLLFSGDTILGRGTTLIALPEGNMIDYLQTLRRLKSFHLMQIAPGHGPPISDPDAKIDEYLKHRLERESEVLDALRAGNSTIGQLVEAVYRPASDEASQLATLSIGAQLDKLTREGAVVRLGESYAVSASS